MKETKPFIPKVLEDLAWLIFQELHPGLSDLLMWEIDHFLDYLHGIYLIRFIQSKGHQIDYEIVVEVVQDYDITYEDFDELV